MPGIGSAKQPGTTTIIFGQQVIYGEMHGSKLTPRLAQCIGFSGDKPVLRITRPMDVGKDYDALPTGYADELTKACWSNIADVPELTTLTAV